ncbi:MAG: radical SAM protein [Proteobacteria bacterium]|nr:radical SAM protein [Pseudomonadota bacterium]
MEDYYIVYNPMPFYLMDLIGRCKTPMDVLRYLTGRDPLRINERNFKDYLLFNPRLQKRGMVDTLALESKAADYIANQVAKAKPLSRVILGDCRRRRIDQIMDARCGQKPKAVFITSMSANFPTAAMIALVLNHARIPVVIGGIHVSTSPDDVDQFIRHHAPFPEYISQVTGAGDSTVMSRILDDIGTDALKKTYTGDAMIEDGIWGAENVDPMVPMELVFLENLPLIGGLVKKLLRINPITPYLGCPFSCHFCSISSLPQRQRRLVSRSPEDFVSEIKHMQKDGVNFQNRVFFFLPDNLLLGGERLEALLDAIIESDVMISYAAQISIDVARNPELLQKLRASGAIHFFIGFESLDMDNLRSIGKSIVPHIEKNGQTVRDYYSAMIRTIQSHGISVHGAFIFGLPNDDFQDLDNHTGKDIADFCKEHHIGIQGCPLTDLPGSLNFKLAQENKTYIYGKQGTMDYFLALCVSDLSECNRKVPETLDESMLVVLHMTYDAIRRVGARWNVLKNSIFVFFGALRHPSKTGRHSLKQRIIEAFISGSAQMIVNNLYHANETVYSKPGVRGSYERYFEREKNESIRNLFRPYVKQFTTQQPRMFKLKKTEPVKAKAHVEERTVL